jgi:hypothetical protein
MPTCLGLKGVVVVIVNKKVIMIWTYSWYHTISTF